MALYLDVVSGGGEVAFRTPGQRGRMQVGDQHGSAGTQNAGPLAQQATEVADIPDREVGQHDVEFPLQEHRVRGENGQLAVRRRRLELDDAATGDVTGVVE